MLKSVFELIPRRALLAGGCACRNFHSSSSFANFWEPDRKSGYKTKIKMPQKEQFLHGLKLMKGEMLKFKDEVSSDLRCDNVMSLEHGDYEVVFKFDNHNAVNDWVVTSDKDHNEGYSRSEFVFGTNGHGIFRGRLDTTMPKDGITKNAGYCNIRSPSNKVRWHVISAILCTQNIVPFFSMLYFGHGCYSVCGLLRSFCGFSLSNC